MSRDERNNAGKNGVGNGTTRENNAKSDAVGHDSAGSRPAEGKGTFNARVYEVVKRIPAGCVATYGQVAALAGRPRNARFVGFALHVNPEPGVIPCHRVVFRDGSLAPGFAFGGAQRQRELLEREGVVFVPPVADKANAGADGWRVDLDRCQWRA